MELIKGNYYHIFNRANGESLLFYENDNYIYFLSKLKEYLNEYLNFYSYCLIPNHFHLLVSVKEIEGETNLSKVFSNFFNCYSKSINKQQSRQGSLFNKPFKRKLIDKPEYLYVLVNYIHRNPVHHGLTTSVEEYDWTSYNSIMNNDESLLDLRTLIDWYGDLETFDKSVKEAILDFKNLEIE